MWYSKTPPDGDSGGACVLEAHSTLVLEDGLDGWPEDVKPDSKFKITIKNKKEFTVTAGEPLLNSMEKNGVIVPSLCRSGECSLCRVKLISGKVYQPEGVKLRQADRRFGYIHSCAAFPITDCEIML